MTTPSFGIIVCHHTGKKSVCKYNQGIESDFYPDFSCRKLKLKWNLTKFDSRQTQMISNLSTLTVTPTNINSPILGSNPSAPSSRSPLSIHQPFHFQLHYLTPSEERPSTRPILTRFIPFPIASTSRNTTGTVLIPLWPIPSDLPALTPQVPVQTLTTGLPPTSSLHPQPQNLDPPALPVCAFVALTFVIVIPSS